VRQRIASGLAIVILAATAASGQTAKNDPQAAQQLREAYGRLAGLLSYRVVMGIAPGVQMGGQSVDHLAILLEVVQPQQFRATAESDNFAIEDVVVAGVTRYRLTKMTGSPRQPGGDMGVLGFLSTALPSLLNPAGAMIGAASMAAYSMLAPNKMTPPIGVWQCPQALGAGGSQGAAGKTGGELAISRMDDVKIDGATAEVFLATQASQQQGSSFTIKMRVYVLKESGLPRRVEMLDASGHPTITMDYRDYNALFTIVLPQCGQAPPPSIPR
jgi:hypothetical protein